MTFMIQHAPKTLIDKGVEDGSNPLGLIVVPQQCAVATSYSPFPTNKHRVDHRGGLGLSRRR